MAARRRCASRIPGREEGKKGSPYAERVEGSPASGEEGARLAPGGCSGVCRTPISGGGRAAREEERPGKGGAGAGPRPEDGHWSPGGLGRERRRRRARTEASGDTRVPRESSWGCGEEAGLNGNGVLIFYLLSRY